SRHPLLVYYSPSLLCFFSFLCSRPHLHLPSFPTRRSSDLPVQLCIPRPMRMSSSNPLVVMRPIFRPRRVRSVLTKGFEDDILMRSEEHTSELQSHLNLVCRLLLEKKKTNKYNK